MIDGPSVPRSLERIENHVSRTVQTLALHDMRRDPELLGITTSVSRHPETHRRRKIPRFSRNGPGRRSQRAGVIGNFVIGGPMERDYRKLSRGNAARGHEVSSDGSYSSDLTRHVAAGAIRHPRTIRKTGDVNPARINRKARRDVCDNCAEKSDVVHLVEMCAATALACIPVRAQPEKLATCIGISSEKAVRF